MEPDAVWEEFKANAMKHSEAKKFIRLVLKNIRRYQCYDDFPIDDEVQEFMQREIPLDGARLNYTYDDLFIELDFQEKHRQMYDRVNRLELIKTIKEANIDNMQWLMEHRSFEVIDALTSEDEDYQAEDTYILELMQEFKETKYKQELDKLRVKAEEKIPKLETTEFPDNFKYDLVQKFVVLKVMAGEKVYSREDCVPGDLMEKINQYIEDRNVAEETSRRLEESEKLREIEEGLKYDEKVHPGVTSNGVPVFWYLSGNGRAVKDFITLNGRVSGMGSLVLEIMIDNYTGPIHSSDEVGDDMRFGEEELTLEQLADKSPYQKSTCGEFYYFANS